MNQQGTGAGCRIVDLDLLAPLQMPGDNFAHQLRDFGRRVEFAGLLACIGGEIADEVLVDETKHVIILTTIHRNVFNEINQISRGLGLASRVGAEFGKSSLQRVENTIEHFPMRRIDIAGERRKRITHIGNLEIVALLDPRGEQVVIGDEITTFALHEFHNVWIILRELRKIVLSEVTGFQAHQLGFGKELIKDETKNVILVFVRLNLGTHLIGGFPNLRSELLLVHLSLLIAVPANQCTVPRATAHLSQEYRTPAWEQRKLGELFEESDERASDREILSVSVANGIYPASESDRETNPGASLANYKIVHFGDVVYNSMRMWQGAVDASRYDGIVSPAYVVTRPNSEVYARFFARLLRQPMLLKQYQQVSQGNSKDTQVLKFDDFASIGISMPASENEQRQIGAFFDRLDSLITLHQRKYCGVVSWMLGVALVRLGSESDGAFGEMKHVLR